MVGQASWKRILGAQASLPACFGQSVIAGNLAGKDACAPRTLALSSRRNLHSFNEAQLVKKIQQLIER
jgi:hypothetical protein